MLTTEQEEIIGSALSPLFEYLEHEVIVDVASRIKETMSYSRTAELEAQRLHDGTFDVSTATFTEKDQSQEGDN